MSTDDRPPTTAGRLDHLADKIDALEERMSAVEQEQKHAKELLGFQFASVLSKLDSIDARLSAQALALQAKDVEQARMASDPTATPAGQAIMKIVTDMASRMAGIERKVYMAGGAIALITFLAPVIGPVIRASLNLP